MFLALRELKKEKLRFGMIVAVIVLITYLVYFLSALAFGLAMLNRTAIDYWNVDGVIVSKSSNGNIYASSIDESTMKSVKNNNLSAVNVSSTNVFISDDKENSVSIVFIGYDLDNKEVTSPLIEGSSIKNDYEIIVSSNIRDEYNVSLGDSISLSDTGRTFKVVGFTKDSNYNTRPVAYADRKLVSQAMLQYDTSETKNDTQTGPTINMPDRVSALLVRDKASVPNQSTLKENGLLYLDIDDFIDVLPGYKAQVLTFGLMIISLSLIVSVIMGIFMYILTMQKKSVFAILKIQGYKNSYIIRSILIQIITLLIIGISIGLILTNLTVILMPKRVPVLFNWNLGIIVSVFIVITAMIGAVFSARSVLKIDPLESL